MSCDCKKGWRQFQLLCWKNLLLQRKKVVQTVLLIAFPMFSVGLLLFFRMNIRPKTGDDTEVPDVAANWTIYPSFPLGEFYRGINEQCLAYTPRTAVAANIMNRVAQLLSVSTSEDVAFQTEEVLEERMKNNDSFLAGIVFLFDGDAVVPKKVTYKIRFSAKEISWITGTMYPKDWRYLRENIGLFGARTPGYYNTGFLQLQRAVDLSIIQEINKDFDLNSVQLQMKLYPVPTTANIEGPHPILETMLPVLVAMAFILISTIACKDVVLEKEKKLRETMKLMGMRPWIYWLSWFVKFMFFMLAISIIFTVVLHVKMPNRATISYTSASITFVFLLLYSMSLLTFSFAVSTFFSKATTASTVAGIMFCVTYFLPDNFLPKDLSLNKKMLVMLDFNMAMAYGCRRIILSPGNRIGVQWDSLAEPMSSIDQLTALHIFLMLIIDIILYSIITWYLDAVLPGEYGTSKPFYFPMMRSYWFGEPSVVAKDTDEDAVLLASDEEHFEKPPSDAKVGIKVRGLTKVFDSSGKLAVNNLSIEMYEGNITALLGQNGAGKTTMMFMLTGFLTPTEGCAYINGLNIRKDIDRIRENLGMCPQHDVLFDLLTVKEHLVFFARLKGLETGRVESDVTEMINILHLTEKTNVVAKKLSGGMKRKLCVGIALIGDSKFVILDEPTSGMDPEARRQTWDILQSQQKGRTMILSTHFMDEADLLGDRIAIMVDGRIQCYGTPMFLKSKYGIGYHMTVVKSHNCNVDDVVNVVTTHIPDARLESNTGSEIAFILPRDQSSKFEEMFAVLESDQDALGIESFGASVTTMEDVFLKVGHAVDLTVEKQDFTGALAKEGQQNSVFGTEFEKETGIMLNFLQLQGMFDKHLIHSVRNWTILFIQLVLPVLMLLLFCLEVSRETNATDYPPLVLDLSHFSDPVTPYEIRQDSENDNETLRLSGCYVRAASTGGRRVVYLNELPKNSSMDNFILEVAKRSTDDYLRTYLIGATFERNPHGGSNFTITGWFQGLSYHAIAISLSYISNSLMQCFGGQDYQIETINQPLPFKREVQHDVFYLVHVAVDGDTVSISVSFALAFGIAFLTATFAVFLVKERVNGAKHLQFVSGAKAMNFWLATFLWDLINFLVPSALIIILFVAFRLPGYSDSTVIWFVVLDFILFGFAIIPCVCVLSFVFKVPSSAYSWIYFIFLLTSITSFLTVVILKIAYSKDKKYIAESVEWFFYILLPNFCFEKAMRDLYYNFEVHRVCKAVFEPQVLIEFCLTAKDNSTVPCCQDFKDFSLWEFPGIGRSLVFMSVHCIVIILIIAVIESDTFTLQHLKHRKTSKQSNVVTEKLELGSDTRLSLDSDVLIERERVLRASSDDSVVMRELTKFFGDFNAVDQLSLGVPKGECFGLLGVNGAGKTTCFKMLTGELKPTSGDAFIGGHSIIRESGKVHQLVGYCPQFDAIIDQLTVRETLSLFACLRGIKRKHQKQVVDGLIDRLLLTENAGKQCRALSGGNRRKLSVAIALVGEPPILFLDEPTTGMDPVTRRVLWNVLIAVRNSGRTLILTSHSMEECEALCTHLAIMVNGKFQCLGSTQHLKGKFSEGYSLIVKVKRNHLEDSNQVMAKVKQVEAFVNDALPGSILKDYHEGLLNYQIYTPNLPWSRIFGTIEEAKDRLQIEDYSVSQTSLEQVFLTFARMQREPQKLETSWKEKLRRLCCNK